VDLEAIRISVDTRAKRLHKTITDARECLNEELHVETHTTKALIETTQREFQEKLKEVEARAKRRKGTGAGAARISKFDGIISWAVFRRQFETVAEYNC
jgi:hypothetical protein